MRNINNLIILGIVLFPVIFALYYNFKEKKINESLDKKNILCLRPHKMQIILMIFGYFFSFVVGITIIFFTVKGMIKILLIEYSLATFFGIIILAIITFSSFFLTPFFLILINHLWFESKRKIYYDKANKKLKIGEKTIDLNTGDLEIIIQKPTYWIVKPIIYNYSYWSIGNINRKIKIIDRNESFEISELIYIPKELNQLFSECKKMKVVRKNFNWIK